MKSPHRNKALSFLIYIALALVTAYMLIKENPLTLKVEDLAPLDDKIALFSGPMTFRRLLKKPLVINFWATWCPPCQKELPLLIKLAQKYKDRVSFVGATVDSSQADILALKNSLSIPYILGQVDESVSKRWHAQALPTTYVIDLQGRIAWAHAGIVHEAQLEAALEALLKK